MKNKICWGLFAGALGVFAWWTWILTAPNLVLTSWSGYWNWQTWMWENFYANRSLIVTIYLLVIVGLFTLFLLWQKELRKIKSKNLLGIFLLCCVPLIFSFNALSFDVFNYLFNAKMIAVYHANPHIAVALDFASDEWTRFMHNTHTPAPYGFGWTAISLLPYALALGKFLPAWLLFRLSNILLLVGTFYLMRKLEAKIDVNQFSRLSLFFLNPLVLIELVTNMHNDLWMMLPALAALFLIYSTKKQPSPKCGAIILSAFCLGFSFTIKFATLALLPAWIFLLAWPYHKKLFRSLKTEIFEWGKKYFFDICAILLFLPLLTSRSQLFHPWYLLWSLIFVPFVQNRIVRSSLLVLSFSSLLRYVPYLGENGYAAQTLWQQQMISLVPLVIYLLISAFCQYNRKHAKSKSLA